MAHQCRTGAKSPLYKHANLPAGTAKNGCLRSRTLRPVATLCTLFIMAALFVVGCSDPKPIKIGYIGGLTGRVGDLGRAGRDGAIMAVEEINRLGGVNGRPIRLLVRDDQQDVERLAKALSELISQNAKAIIGPMTSAMAVAAAPIANEARVPLVSPTTSTNDLTGIDDYFLRIYPASAQQAEQLADYAVNGMGLKRMAVIYDTRNRAHTESWFRAFKTNFEILDGEIKAALTYRSSDQIGFIPLARESMAVEPDGILLLANALDSALISQSLRRAGYDGAILASEWSATDQVLELGSNAVTDMVFLQTFDRNSKSPDYLGFKKTFKERFNYEPGFAAVHAYDATRLVLDALIRADGADLRTAILTQSQIKGLQTTYSLDQNGDVRRKPFLMTINQGRFVRLD